MNGAVLLFCATEESSPHPANQRHPALEILGDFGGDGLSTQPHDQCAPMLGAEPSLGLPMYLQSRYPGYLGAEPSPGIPNVSALLLIYPHELWPNKEPILLHLSVGCV